MTEASRLSREEVNILPFVSGSLLYTGGSRFGDSWGLPGDVCVRGKWRTLRNPCILCENKYLLGNSEFISELNCVCITYMQYTFNIKVLAVIFITLIVNPLLAVCTEPFILFCYIHRYIHPVLVMCSLYFHKLKGATYALKLLVNTRSISLYLTTFFIRYCINSHSKILVQKAVTPQCS